MKNLLILLALALTPVCGFSAPAISDNELTARLQKEIVQQRPASIGASAQSVIEISLRVETVGKATKNPKYVETLRTRRHCTAVIIDKNWLIASSRCQGTEKTFKHIDSSEGSITEFDIIERNLSAFIINIDGTEYQTVIPFQGSQVFLLYVGHNPEIVAKLAQRPHAGLFIPAGSKTLANYSSQSFLVNREMVLPLQDRAVGQRKIKDCYKDGCVQVDNTFRNMNAYAADPLFIQLSDKTELLAAFNAAKIAGTGYGRSSWYKDLNEDTYQFMKKVMCENAKEDWNRVKAHVLRDIPGSVK